MLSNSQVLGYLRASILSPYCFSCYLFLNKLIKRTQTGSTLSEYRLLNTVTNTPITSVEGIFDSMDPSKMIVDYNFNDRTDFGRPHSFFIIPDDIQVTLSKHCEDDAVFYHYFSDSTRLYFLMNYVTDLDPDIPFKVIDVRLVK